MVDVKKMFKKSKNQDVNIHSVKERVAAATLIFTSVVDELVSVNNDAAKLKDQNQKIIDAMIVENEGLGDVISSNNKIINKVNNLFKD